MCVAVVVESDAPSATDLRNMEIENPHGAGVAFAKGNHIYYRKGLTAAQVSALAERLPRPFLLHFRWATHGPKVPRLTHPFPLGHKAITSNKVRGKAKAVLIHNGVWNECDKYAPPWISLYPETSDTGIAALLAEENESILDKVQWSTAVGRAAGAGRMDVTLRGRWETYKGNQFSNLNWQPSQRWSYGSGWGAGWNWGDDDDTRSVGETFKEWCARQDAMEARGQRAAVSVYQGPGSCPWARCVRAIGHDGSHMDVSGYPIHRIVDAWPEETSTEVPIGMVDLPEETPIEVRDQLLLDEPVRVRVQTDFFKEHEEVQAALAKMEGKCQVPECIEPHGHRGGHFNADNRLIGFTTKDGRLVGWGNDGRMKHLTVRKKGEYAVEVANGNSPDEGCE